MNKILVFVLLLLAFIGIVGGIGYTIWCQAYVISLGLIAAGWMVWPRFMELFKKLTD